MRHLQLLGGVVGILTLTSALLPADPPRVVVGKCATESGTILRRPAGTTKWEVVKKGDPIYSGDMNVGLPGAAIVSGNGAVRVELLADLDGNSPFPIMESAVILKANDKADLDFILDRGRVDLINLKEKDKATVLVHFHHENWTLTLEPQSEVALELYGRWPAGVFCNLKKPSDKQEAPTGNLAVLMMKGEMILDHEDHKHAMRAPPGPALFQWDSIVEEDVGPRRLDKLPDWATDDPSNPLVKRKQAILELFRQRTLATSPEKAAEEALASGDFGYRRLGVVALGATDNLPRLIAALNDPKTPADTREAAVLVLRHWIGRGRGQDAKLHDVLIKQKGFSPAHAELVMLGLHSLCEVELSRPETWEALISYLMHDQQIIRELAHWHLERLVPLGRFIAYDAAGPADERKIAHDKWKKLIPDGQVPAIERLKQKLKDAKEKPDKE